MCYNEQSQLTEVKLSSVEIFIIYDYYKNFKRRNFGKFNFGALIAIAHRNILEII